MNKYLALPTAIVLIFIYVIAWFIQSKFSHLSWDVSWLTIAANRLWLGGSYSKNFFEVTPPFILYLHLPPLLITKWLHISITLTVRTYFFALITLSLYLSTLSLKKISPNNVALQYYLLIVTAAVLLLLPFSEFGEREHLFLVFIFPYLFAITYQLQEKVRLQKSMGFIIGLFAGCGCLIKPHFFAVYFILEFYFLLKERHWRAIYRVENIVILSMLILYIISLFTFTSDYLTVVAPMITKFYYQALSKPLSALLFNDITFYLYLAIPCALIQYKYAASKPLITVFLLTFIACYIFIYLGQQTNFVYHILPALSMAVVIFALFIASLTQQFIKPTDIIYYVLLTVLLVFFTLLHNQMLWKIFIFFPTVYLSYFTIIYFVIFTLLILKRPWYYSAAYLLFTAFFSYSIHYLMMHRAHGYYIQTSNFYISHFVFFSLLYLFIPKKHKIQNLYMLLLAYLLFSILLEAGIIRINSILAEQEWVTKNIDAYTVKNHKPASVYYFSVFCNYNFHVPQNISNTMYGSYPSSFFSLWMLPGIAAHPKTTTKEKQTIINMVVSDLTHNQPAFVLVDTMPQKSYFKTPSFDYLSFFNQDAGFRRIWQHYHYMTTLKKETLALHIQIQYDVYERVG